MILESRFCLGTLPASRTPLAEPKAGGLMRHNIFDMVGYLCSPSGAHQDIKEVCSSSSCQDATPLCASVAISITVLLKTRCIFSKSVTGRRETRRPSNGSSPGSR